MIKIACIVCGFLLIFNLSNAQEKIIKKADRSFDNYSFMDAIASYRELIDQGYETDEIFEKLGNTYYKLGDYKEASFWYEKSAQGGRGPQAAKTLFQFAHSLKSQEDYDTSDKWMQKFYEAKPLDHRALKFDQNRNYRFQIEEYSNRYSIKSLSVNSKESDFAPSLINEKLIFSSARDKGLFSRNIHPWNNKPFHSLYEASISDKLSYSSPAKWSKELDTKAHESSTAFSKDGNTLYFTRNNFRNGKFTKGDHGMNRLKIYKAIKEKGEWKKVVELPFNSDDYSVAHPALSVDGKRLYFASDMPGSMGNSDIFYVDIHSDGTFGDPINMGADINTEGRETFPFVTTSNMLYFASDGHLGLGGLDIFATQLEDARNSCVVNIGEPINSPADDFALVLGGSGNSGYFTSNREGGMGSDDIYYFLEEKPIEIKCVEIITGIVRNEIDGQPLAASEIKVYDHNNNIVVEGVSASSGAFKLEPAYKPGDYKIVVHKEGYGGYEAAFIMRKDQDINKMKISLEPEKAVLAPENTNLVSFLKLSPILFDYGKWDINDEAKINLNKIVSYMKTFPTLKTEIRSYTDSRSSESYNLGLSKRRGLETKRYLVSKGINPSRVSAKGFGEIGLINNCGTGVKCSEEQHQLNRRSEFIVVK